MWDCPREWNLEHYIWSETEAVCKINRKSTLRTAERTCWQWESMEAFCWKGDVTGQSWVNIVYKYLSDLQLQNPLWLVPFLLFIARILWVNFFLVKVSLEKELTNMWWIYPCRHIATICKPILKILFVWRSCN